jgi:hypothetical protein
VSDRLAAASGTGRPLEIYWLVLSSAHPFIGGKFGRPFFISKYLPDLGFAAVHESACGTFAKVATDTEDVRLSG